MSDEAVKRMISAAFASMPEPHRSAVKNVAIILADDPSQDQRQELELRSDQTLLGLYTGVPLAQRQGRTDLPPDVITLFKKPLLADSSTETELYENIRHTLWHELAHYFGLGHKQIHDLE